VEFPVIASSAIYGLIAVATLLSAESARRETYPATVGAVLLTLLLYWLGHSYAHYTGERLAEGERMTVSGLGRTMGAEAAILIGAAVPLAEILIWWALGQRLTSAVTVAVWTAAGLIVVTELVIARRAELTGRDLIAQVSMGATLGLIVIAIWLVLH
jgi:hypothetical protein